METLPANQTLIDYSPLPPPSQENTPRILANEAIKQNTDEDKSGRLRGVDGEGVLLAGLGTHLEEHITIQQAVLEGA